MAFVRKLIAVAAIALMLHAASAEADPETSPGATLRADQFDQLEGLFNARMKNYQPQTPNSYLPIAYLLGRMYYTSEVLPNMDRWVAAKPNSYWARLLRGSFLIEHALAVHGGSLGASVGTEATRIYEESLRKADADLIKAVEINPGLPFAQSRQIMIDILLDRGRETATPHYISARQADPSYTPAYAAYMMLLAPRRGGSAEMMRTFVEKNAGAIPGSNLPLLWGQFHSEMAMPGNEGPSWWKEPGVWEQVEKVYAEVIPIQPDATGLRSIYALLANSAGHFEVLPAQLEAVGPYWGKYVPEDAQREVFTCLERAWPDADANQWMIDRASAELAKNPNAARPLFLRGVAQCRSKKYVEAVADLTRAIELDPDLVSGWMELAIAYDQTQQSDKALGAAEHYLSVRPYAETMIRIKGDALKAAGKPDDAIAFYRTKLKLYPWTAEVYGALAALLREKRDWPALIATCEQGLTWAGQQKNEQVQFNLYWLMAIARQQTGDIQRAFEAFAESLKYDPGEQTLDRFAELYHAGGRWSPLREQIVDAVEQNYRARGDDAKRKAGIERFKAKISGRTNKF